MCVSVKTKQGAGRYATSPHHNIRCWLRAGPTHYWFVGKRSCQEKRSTRLVPCVAEVRGEDYDVPLGNDSNFTTN